MDAKQMISALRKRGMSQKKIAERCGLSQGAVSHIETGRRKNVLAKTHQALADLYAESDELQISEAPEAA